METKKIKINGNPLLLIGMFGAMFVFALFFFIVPPILSNKYSETDYVILEGTFEYSAYNSEGHYRDVYKVNVGNEEKLVNVQSDGEKKDATYTMKFKYKPEEEKFYLYDPNEKEEKDTSGIQFSLFGGMFLLIIVFFLLRISGTINDQIFGGFMFCIFGITGSILLILSKDYSTLPVTIILVIIGIIVCLSKPYNVKASKKEEINNE